MQQIETPLSKEEAAHAAYCEVAKEIFGEFFNAGDCNE